MSYESKVCRTYLDVTEVTKTQLVSAVFSSKEKLGLSDEQVKGLAAVLDATVENSKNAGLNALQRLGSQIDSEVLKKEVEGKKKPKNSKSEAA
jgi:hypothetical protein